MTGNRDAESEQKLAGLRVLLVEDEDVLAITLEDLLTQLGCHILPASQLEQAIELARTESIDGALLDVNLSGERVYSVADELATRDIPFLFMTGYSTAELRPQWRDRPVLHKPFMIEDLEQAMMGFVLAK